MSEAADGEGTPAASPQLGIWERLKTPLETVPKAAVLVGAVAYVCGLVILTTHLQKYGSTTLGFFAPQYIAAGAWFLLVTGWFFLSAYVFTRSMGVSIKVFEALERLGPFEGIPSRLQRIMAVVLGIVALVILTVVFGQLLLVLSIRPAWAWLFVALPAFLVGMFVANVDIDADDNEQFGRALIALVLIGPIILGAFAYSIYPSIPARWGGGGALGVRLLVSSADAARLQRAGIVSDTLEPATGRLLLLTDEDVLFLPAGQEKAVLLRRSGVLALELEPADAFDLARLVRPWELMQRRVDTLSGTPHRK